MKIFGVHPSPLMYSEIYLRLEPLGLELVAEALRRAGHTITLLDLQVEPHKNYFKIIDQWRPDAVVFSLSYLANVPEVIDLAKETKRLLPDCFILVGGHSASFVAKDILLHAEGAIDCVLKGEGETSVVELLETGVQDVAAITQVPGAITVDGEGPLPRFVKHLPATRTRSFASSK